LHSLFCSDDIQYDYFSQVTSDANRIDYTALKLFGNLFSNNNLASLRSQMYPNIIEYDAKVTAEGP